MFVDIIELFILL